MLTKTPRLFAFCLANLVLLAASSATAQQTEEDVVTCYVKATAISTNPMGYTETHYSDWKSNSDCDMAKEDARLQVLTRVPSQNTLNRIAYDCVPQQFCTCCDETNVAELRSSRCWYKVVFTIRCCNGASYTHTATDPDRKLALQRARDAACFWASLTCNGRIRCCCWRTYRVPGPAQLIPVPAQ